MCLRSLGFVLIFFPGVLLAQRCDAPRLRGYFIPEQETYSNKAIITYSCDNGYKPVVEGWWATSTCERGKWSHEPQCIGSSNETRETRLCYTTIQNCGNIPVIENAFALQTSQYYLTYQCQRLYRLVGPETVKCISSRMWSDLPECRAKFCAVNTNDNPEYISVGTVYIENGEEERVECVKPHSWSLEHYTMVRCINGRVEATECCNWMEHKARGLLCD
ncbi:complement factor H-like [Neolamprologus brichardi]|uniref:complement factor H-like n=1 Tax=Neolamprologus brichardi TaxID=32507 RepID=UPI001643B66B|nr:complement factor H-like [Neolamprologus brichardi]